MNINTKIANLDSVDEVAKIALQTSEIHYRNIENEFKEPSLEDMKEYIKAVVENENSMLLIAFMDNKIVGYIALYINSYPDRFFINSKRGFIGSVGVDENVRGQGIGKSLLSFAEQVLQERKIKVLEVDHYVFNTQADKLYKNFGFKDLKQYKRKELDFNNQR